MTRCMGGCKSSRTKDFTPEVVVHPAFGWIFMLHDTLECPDRVKWRMDDIIARAVRLRDERNA